MRGYFSRRALLTCCISALAIATAAAGSPGQVGQPGQPKLQDLQQIGEKIAAAVLSHDIATLLEYDRPDLRSQDQVWLRNPASDLYCYIFGGTCLPKGKRSVYEILSTAKERGVRVYDLGRSTTGEHYALLLFYDRSSIPDRQLRTKGFLCSAGGKRLASWEFEFISGRWRPANPLFDTETGSPC